MKCVEKVKALPFFNDLKAEEAKVYVVGGAVRDHFLGKESKDLDILVSNIELDKLITILSKYGKVDQVGKSFGIIKFKEKGGEEIDIALPRTEKKKDGGKHTDFEVTVDPFMKIEDDLSRRDFTINAIAVECRKGTELWVIDPFDGREDIKYKLIKRVSEKTFMEDPLRMLRAVQFAARFDFEIEEETRAAIFVNRNKLKDVSKERVLIELEKMVSKGVSFVGLNWLAKLDLLAVLFCQRHNRYDTTFKVMHVPEGTQIPVIDDLAQFLYLACGSSYTLTDDVYKDYPLDKVTSKKLKVLRGFFPNGFNAAKVYVFENLRHYPEMLTSPYFNVRFLGHSHIKQFAISEFKTKNYPKSIKELDITSEELMDMGYLNERLGEVYKFIVKRILYDKIPNKKEEIIKLLTKK